MGDLAPLVRSQRTAFIDLLESLSDDEWAAPSLCRGWTVLDVAAHLAAAPSTSLPTAVRTAVACGFRVNAVNDRLARDFARRGRGAVLDRLRDNRDRGRRPPGVPEVAALADAVCHMIDVRHPLRRSAPLDPAAFAPVADLLATMRWPATLTVGGGGRRATAGLRLVAEDVGWSRGTGPEVRADGEAMLRALGGRPVGPAELFGAGAAAFADRVASR
ncbi:maleylpyruvate isomerase family mycothiol-dependent enzyme [Thalassiella azotivora]